MSYTTHEKWKIEFNSGIPVYKQIINHVSAALAGGLFRAGDRLPTIRELHQQLDVNPNTVAKAYRELELKGIITSERGNGSFISEGAVPVKLTAAQRNERLQGFYQRILAEAAGSGFTEAEIVKFILERKNHVQ